MPTGAFGQIYGQGVKYIKVNRYDSGGLDRSDYLGQLTNLTINYDDLGSITYNIVTTQEQNDYFVYGIQTQFQSLTSSNYEVLDYRFSASCVGPTTAPVPPPNTEAYVIINNYTESYDSLNYFNSSTGTYTFSNTPNIQIEATYSFKASVSTGTVGIEEAYVDFMLFGGTHGTFGEALESKALDGITSSPTTFNGSFIVNPKIVSSIIGTFNNHIIEGDHIQVRINNTSASPGTVSITDLRIFFTQSTIPNSATPPLVIFEPEFIDWDYNDYNALFGNAEIPQVSTQFMDVDYTSTYDKPVNFDLIISGTADRALVQDSNYSSYVWSALRYWGSRYNSFNSFNYVPQSRLEFIRLGGNVTTNIGNFNDPSLDGSGYGELPAVEQNQTYIAYFDGVGGTGPEIIGQTAYNIKYLIDTQGNIANPEPGVPALYNLIDNFEPGKKAIVRLINNDPTLTENPNDDALTGIHNISYVGRISPILITETGSALNHYVTTMSFQNINITPIFGNAYDYNVQVIRNSSPQTLSTSYQYIDFQEVTLDENSLWDATDRSIVFPNNTATNGFTRVSFKFKLIPNPYQYNTFETIYGSTQVVLNTAAYTYDFRIVTASSADPTNFNHILIEALGNYSDISIEAQLPNWYNFRTGDRVRIEARTNFVPYAIPFNIVNNPGIKQNSYFRTVQEITPGLEVSLNGINQTTSSYWTTNQFDQPLSALTASLGLSNLYTGEYRQITPTASLAFGFNNIFLPFSPQIGDWIRFEYNRNKVFNVVRVEYIDGRLILITNPGVPSGTILDHFVLYRILNDGTYIILNIEKPVSGSSFTGIIQPEQISQELSDNYSNIIQDLTQKNLIS